VLSSVGWPSVFSGLKLCFIMTASRPADIIPPHFDQPITWQISQTAVAYDVAIRAMEQRVRDISRGQASELVWLLEHPDLYTAGTSANPADLLDASALPVFQSGRGGQYTYHGPDQRIAYVMLDIKRRFAGDVRAFVDALEAWGIATLAHFGIEGRTYRDRVGIWVRPPSSTTAAFQNKIAAIGIRVRHGISYHGLSLNVAPKLAHYDGIVPCGLKDFGVTSFADLGIEATLQEVDQVLKTTFTESVLNRAGSSGPGY
jgi:lipoyl(octanoyl) transferase